MNNNNGRELSFYGLRALFRAHPGKKWYLKADDDTFLFPTNLLFALSQWPLPFAERKPQLGREYHVWSNFSGPNWQSPTFLGRIKGDKYTVSGGAGFAISAGLLNSIGGVDSPIFDMCLNGSSFPDVASFDNGHGYNEDWLWKKCLLLHNPETQFYHSPSLHMSTPLEQWADWHAGDTVSHFPSSFHWVKDPKTAQQLHSCQFETKRQVIQSHGFEHTIIFALMAAIVLY